MEDKEDKEELMNKEEFIILPMPQGTSHCSCLEHCFLLVSSAVGCIRRIKPDLRELKLAADEYADSMRMNADFYM